MNKRLLLGAAFAALATIAATDDASAQTACPTGGGLVACVEQVGDRNTTSVDQAGGRDNRAVITADGNRNRINIDQSSARDSVAAVSIQGNRNGRGASPGGDQPTTRAGYVPRGPITNLRWKFEENTGPAAPLTFESVEYGQINQEGREHTAVVGIVGNDNGFHIGQSGRNNTGVQLIAGDDNGAVLLQDGRNNIGVQGVAGDLNRSYLEQDGDNNVGVLLQASAGAAPVSPLGVMELAGGMELGVLRTAGGGAKNSVMLEQSGNNNIAALTQLGSGNSLALRQPGNAFAAITQTGGDSLSITQTGRTPIIVIQR